MNKYFFSLAALFVILGIALAAVNPKLNIWWGKSKLIETLSQGETKTIEVVFSSPSDLGEVSLDTSDTLSNFIVGFSPAKIIVEKNNPYKFDLTIKIPDDTPLGTYGGTIHLRQNKKTISKPLPVNLIVKEKEITPPPLLSFEWETPVNISNLPFNSYRSKVISDYLGNVYVIWLNSDFDHQYNLYYAKLENGVWSTPRIIIANDGNYSISDFDIDVDHQNHIFLTFTQNYPDSGYGINYMIYDGNTWSSPTKLTTGSYPSVAIDSNDKIHLVYSGAGDVYYTVFDGITWSTPYNISKDGNFYDDNTNGQKAIRVDTNNKVHIAWSKWNYGIMYTQFDGIDWATPQLVSQLASQAGYIYWLSIGANNTVTIAYTQGPNDCQNQEIYLALSTDNGISWPTAGLISNKDGIGSRWPSVFVVSPTNIQVIWSECTAFIPFRFYNGTSWSDIVDLGHGVLSAEMPNLYSFNNISYAVWSYNGNIYFTKTK